MVLSGAIEGRGDDLSLHRALHVGDLFGALVDEHDHEVDLGVVLRDRVGNLLQDDGLARLGRRDDEAALALADRGDQVDDALGQLLGGRLQTQTLLRVERRELAELHARGGVVDREAVDRVDLDQRVVLLAALLLALAGLLDRTDDGVALAQVVLLHLSEGHVHVAGAGEVAGRADESVVVEHIEDAGDRDQDVVLADLGVELVGRGAAAALVALTVAVVAAGLVVVGRRLRLLLLLFLRGAVLPASAIAATAAVAAATALLLATIGGVGVVVLRGLHGSGFGGGLRCLLRGGCLGIGGRLLRTAASTPGRLGGGLGRSLGGCRLGGGRFRSSRVGGRSLGVGLLGAATTRRLRLGRGLGGLRTCGCRLGGGGFGRSIRLRGLLGLRRFGLLGLGCRRGGAGATRCALTRRCGLGGRLRGCRGCFGGRRRLVVLGLGEVLHEYSLICHGE